MDISRCRSQAVLPVRIVDEEKNPVIVPADGFALGGQPQVLQASFYSFLINELGRQKPLFGSGCPTIVDLSLSKTLPTTFDTTLG